MIDDIVEMIFKEAKKRDCENPSMELYELLREINNKVWTIAREDAGKERRKKDNESEG